MDRKVAVLSNINADYVSRELKREFQVWEPEGYGNVWEQQLNPSSSLSQFAPDVVVLVIDAWQLLGEATSRAEAEGVIEEWFSLFDSARMEVREYLVSDIQIGHKHIMDMDEPDKDKIERCWEEKLEREIADHANVHHLRLRDAIAQVGTRAFYSELSWYLGKMPYTRDGYQKLTEQIRLQIRHMYDAPKKVLVLDLDNTLWGGVLGELGELGIVLSDDKEGAIYRDSQKLVKQMRLRGVMLAICSKNNIGDVRLVWEKNPYMILKEDDFVSVKVNWEDKVDNLKEMAQQLNLGLDSFVFIDDMEAERENVKMRLPMVAVPDFPNPNRKERIPLFFQQVYEEYFLKSRATQEDLQKTEQYQQNEKRSKLQEQMDYDAFLRHLELRAERAELNDGNMSRIAQLVKKSNQFNLTTKRYAESELRERVAHGWRLYAWDVKDKFGDYGLVSVVLVNMDADPPVIDLFLMSCRIMGKKLENYFLEQVEDDMRSLGKPSLWGEYIASEKNLPVRDFYGQMGYQIVEKSDANAVYEMDLGQCAKRDYFVNGR